MQSALKWAYQLATGDIVKPGNPPLKIALYLEIIAIYTINDTDCIIAIPNLFLTECNCIQGVYLLYIRYRIVKQRRRTNYILKNIKIRN
jgi:hypothetical protein